MSDTPRNLLEEHIATLAGAAADYVERYDQHQQALNDIAFKAAFDGSIGILAAARDLGIKIPDKAQFIHASGEVSCSGTSVGAWTGVTELIGAAGAMAAMA